MAWFLLNRRRKCQFALFFNILKHQTKQFECICANLILTSSWSLLCLLNCLMWENINLKTKQTVSSLLSNKEVEDYLNHSRLWCPFSLTSKSFAIPQSICSVLVPSGCQTQVQAQGCQNSQWHIQISDLFFFRQKRTKFIYLLKLSDSTLMMSVTNHEFVGIISSVR